MRDLPGTTREAAEESWVLGHAEQVPTEGVQLVALEDAVVELYEKEFERRWDALLGDLSLIPFRDQQQTIRDLYILSSPQSPLRDLLMGITRQLRVTAPDASKAAPASGGGTKSVLSAAGISAANAAPAPAATLPAVEAHFQPLLDLVGTGGAAPLGNVLRMINQLQQVLAAPAPGSAPLPPALQSSGDPAQLLLAEADRQPVPVSGWLGQIATSGNAILGKAPMRPRRRLFKAATDRRHSATTSSMVTSRSTPSPGSTRLSTISRGCSGREDSSIPISKPRSSPSSIRGAPNGSRMLSEVFRPPLMQRRS
jgi:type VI secretion system protein ImpL